MSTVVVRICRTVAGGAVLASVTLAAITCRSQPAVEVTFEVVTTTPVAAQERVYVTGGADTLGNWHPSGLALARRDSVTWHAGASFRRRKEIEFKVTKGSWNNEALRADGTVPPNHRFRAEVDTTIRVLVSAWKDRPRVPEVTGDIRIHHGLTGPGLEARDVIVWLPPGYAASPHERYPVLYALDGQNLFDPGTSFTGVDWQLDEHADSLIAKGRMRKLIIVGIHNTTDRTEEYHDTELGKKYRSFVIDSVKTMIDATYRTLPDRDNTAVMGSSSGGFAAFLFLWRHPDVVSMAACLSPYFPNSLPRKVVASGWQASDQILYMDNGGDELDTRLQEGIDRMLPALKTIGFSGGSNFTWIRYPDDSHNEASWAARVWKPLLIMFGTDSGRQ